MFFTAPSLAGIVHGFGVRGLSLEDHLRSLELGPYAIAETDQVHGNRVHFLRRNSGASVLAGDAFVTNERGVVCFVRTADCVPILIADKKRMAVAAVHAGWRGTALDVVGETIGEMKRLFGTNPADCKAAIGPSICGKCYEVGEEVIGALHNLELGETWRTGERHVELGEVGRLLLERAGVLNSNISIIPKCAYCDTTFASWRRDRREDERQFNFILPIESPQPPSVES